MAISYHHVGLMASTALQCQGALTFVQQLLSLSVSITNNTACHQCHMARCKRPPKAAFEMSMAAGSAEHICSSLGSRVIYSITDLSNQLVRGDGASSDVFNGLRCSRQRSANLFLLYSPPMPFIFSFIFETLTSYPLLPSFPCLSSLVCLFSLLLQIPLYPFYPTSPLCSSAH